MKLAEAFRLTDVPCLALVGAGGKTTALFQLARELTTPSSALRPSFSSLHPCVLVTATTHLHANQIELADSHWIAQKPEDLARLEDNLRGVVLVTGLLDGDRTKGVGKSSLCWLREFALNHNLPLLIEADGSRQKPLKAPEEHEPAIPEFIEMVVVVAGLSGLGKPLTEECVQRPDIFARLSGLGTGDIITPEAVIRVLTHPAGGLKNIPPQARRVALLNQADSAELQSLAGRIAGELLPHYGAVIIASLQPQALAPRSPALACPGGQARAQVQAGREPAGARRPAAHLPRRCSPGQVPGSASVNTNEHGLVYSVHEKTAGIILAAGASERLGQPKQLLDWRGQPFIRAVAQTALAADLFPIIVVTGSRAEEVEAAIRDLPVTITRNRDWQSGQSSSIRAGLIAMPPPSLRVTSPISGIRNGGGREGVSVAIFLLADQPQVTPSVLRALVERHSLDLSPIVAPQVQGQRANPVLFDRVTFPDLLALTGDVGGRGIFSKHPVTTLPWHDESLLLDVDTPEDYKKLEGWGS
jgi:molybdenum cofactor cytidylyltransferase